MLTLKIPKTVLFNEQTSKLIRVEEQTLKFEHSLISISEWESKWHVPFFEEKNKTREMTVDYIRCMCLSKNVDDNVFLIVASKRDLNDKITAYIKNPMTASWINDRGKKETTNKRVTTSELIYYYMFSYGIPKDCEKWHINRLIMLIRIFNAENQDPKNNKLSSQEAAAQRRKLNAQRRKAAHSRG